MQSKEDDRVDEIEKQAHKRTENSLSERLFWMIVTGAVGLAFVFLRKGLAQPSTAYQLSVDFLILKRNTFEYRIERPSSVSDLNAPISAASNFSISIFEARNCLCKLSLVSFIHSSFVSIVVS